MRRWAAGSKKGREPNNEREKKFADAYLRSHDAQAAWLEAGYSPHTGTREAAVKVQLLAPYIERTQNAIAKEVSKVFVLDQQTILDEMIAVAFANPQDYIDEVVQIVDGQEVRKHVRKPIMSLTRSQAAAISEITFNPDGTVSYVLPGPKEKHPFQKDLGQHLGLFHPKLIQEHRHRHMHAHIDMKDVDQKSLLGAEQMLLQALGHRGNLLLGLQPHPDDEDESENI